MKQFNDFHLEIVRKISALFCNYHDTRNIRATFLKIIPYVASQEIDKNHQTHTPSCSKSL